MKVRLGDLEEIRGNIVAYRKRMEAGPPKWFPKSHFRVLQFAVRRFHKTGNLEDATRHLETLFDRCFKRRKALDKLTGQLHLYVGQFEALGNAVVRTFVNAHITLADGYEPSGQVSRLDLVPSGGYAAWVFTKEPMDWRSQLRMPLIQGFFADDFGVPPNEVSIGVYDFSTGSYDCVRFSASDILRARAEALGLLRTL